MIFSKSVKFTILILIFIWTPVYSISSITIKKIDPINQFPHITIEFSFQKPATSEIYDLDEKIVSVYEDGQKISNIKLAYLYDSSSLIYFIFSIDSSKSLNKENLEILKNTAIKIIKQTGEKDNIALYKFDDKLKIINNFTTNKDLLINNIEGITRHGKKTLLYNSIYNSLEHLSKVNSSKKFLIVLTDGVDDGSTINENDIMKFNSDIKIPIYFIFPKKVMNKNIINKISKITGGKIYHINKTDISNRIIKSLNNDIKKDYRLEYDSLAKKDGMDHTIELKIKDENHTDYMTEKYTVPKNAYNINNLYDTKFLLIVIIILLIPLLILNIYIVRKKYIPFVTNKEYEKNLPVIKSSEFEQNNRNDQDELINLEEKKNILSQDTEDSYTDAWLIEKNGTGMGIKHPIYRDEILIGSNDDCNIILHDNSISSFHTKIKNIQDRYYIFDLISDKGTFLNGKKLLRPKSIHDFDEITIGRTSFIFRGSKIINI